MKARHQLFPYGDGSLPMLCWGSDQIVIVNVPRAFTKKNLESIPPIILFLGRIFLVFGYFGLFGLMGL